MSTQRDMGCLCSETGNEPALPRGAVAIIPRMRRYLGLVSFLSVVAAACSPRSAADMSNAEKTAIADSLKHLVVSAYDLSKPDAVARLMSLYPTQGRVVSASGGVTTTTRAQLQQAIQAFWAYV